MENKFLNEKYSIIYNLEFSYFVDCIVKDGGEDLLNEYNLKISNFVFKYADDPMIDLNGIHRFIEGMAKDKNLYNLDAETYDIRNKTHDIFTRKMQSLIEAGYYSDFEITEEITEAVFIKASLEVFLNAMKEKMGIK
jgi:hypothetical protein